MTDLRCVPTLELRGISKRIGAVQTLDCVDFEAHPQEVLGLVGDHGAGTSTLVKIVSGVYRPSSGEYFFEGQPVSVNRPSDATRLGIETVIQDLALCDNLDVVANQFLGTISVGVDLALLIGEIDLSVGVVCGDVLLNAIAAAVIGGTSLFGGRGSTWSALLGALVIGAIANGMDLLAFSSSVNFMVTGVVLLLAVTVDAFGHARREQSGT